MKLCSLSLPLLAVALVASAHASQPQPGQASTGPAQVGESKQSWPNRPPVGVQPPQTPQAPQAPRTFVWVQSPKVKVGAPAPAFQPGKWVKGGPVILGNGKVTVVNFWATWSPPTKETFGPVADLFRRYKGKADFIGVSVLERSSDVQSGVYVKNVENFVRSQGRDLPYPVAVDDAQNTLAKEWLVGAGQSIPVSYIVDRTGRIAWIGHPLADLDEVLPQVIKGKYDTQKAAQEQHARIVVEGQLRDLIIPVQSAVQMGNPAGAVLAIDRAIEKNANLVAALAPTKFQMLLQSDEVAAYAYAKSLADGAFKDNPTGLNLLAWYIVEDKTKLKRPDYPLAVSIAKRASDLTENSDPYILDTLALALYRTGDRVQALDIQTRAVALGEVKKGIDPRILAQMRERLAKFRQPETP